MPNVADLKRLLQQNNQIFIMHIETVNWHSLFASAEPLTGKLHR